MLPCDYHILSLAFIGRFFNFTDLIAAKQDCEVGLIQLFVWRFGMCGITDLGEFPGTHSGQRAAKKVSACFCAINSSKWSILGGCPLNLIPDLGGTKIATPVGFLLKWSAPE